MDERVERKLTREDLLGRVRSLVERIESNYDLIDSDGLLPESEDADLQDLFNHMVEQGIVSSEINEGLDGVGKATQIRIRALEYLRLGFNVARIPFPQYKTWSGKMIRNILTSEHLLPPSEVFSDPYLETKMNWEKTSLQGNNYATIDLALK